MQLLKTGMKGLAQYRLHTWLNTATRSPLAGAVTGMVLTMLVQSSSAVTVITIGMVSSGLLSFSQAIGVVLGTNVGTTVTAQLMAFDLGQYGLPITATGVMMVLVGRKTVRRLGTAVAGLGVVFLGLDMMESAATSLQYRDGLVIYLINMGQHPFQGLVAGLLATAVLQSSSLVIGIIITLADQALVSLPGAVALVLGSNIGTCITAVLAGLGGTTDARRVAMAHVLLNIIGALVFFPFIDTFARLVSLTSPYLPRQIANAHTIFNFITSLAVLPWAESFAKVVCRLVPGRH
ncbi:hypothetical protein SY88_03925 [Clostridiales bacterium PH28_bin88]|nr:hypothetical protein SY88_03925 [Clostridiales bacterium PH28_bin88]